MRGTHFKGDVWDKFLFYRRVVGTESVLLGVMVVEADTKVGCKWLLDGHMNMQEPEECGSCAGR